jgi:competence protein ComFB
MIMALTDDYSFEFLVNEAEKLVFDELERQLAAYTGDLCRCSECVVDMAAIALNKVKPMYRFSLLGSLYTSQAMSDDAFATGLRSAVSMAIERVRTNPSHGPLVDGVPAST